jgi:hypothetical protein
MNEKKSSKMSFREIMFVTGTLIVFPLVSCNYNHDEGDLQQEHLHQSLMSTRHIDTRF